MRAALKIKIDSDTKWKYAALAVLALSIVYLFFFESYLFSLWRKRDYLGEIKLESEIERRDAYGGTEWTEGRVGLFVGDKVDGEFNEAATFRAKGGGSQLVSYPFRVHRTSENEILFSPLMRRTHNVSWVSRRPQRFLPSWESLLKEWERLQGEWAAYKTAHPLRTAAATPGPVKRKRKGVKAP